MQLNKSQPSGCTVSLPDDNIHVWEVLIPGPPESLYRGGEFRLRITIPDNYPMKAPYVHFVTPIYHLNVSEKCGQVCLSFLSDDNWAVTSTMEQIIQTIVSLLIKPDTTSSFDHDRLNKFEHYKWDYEKLAIASAVKANKK
ncbi:unnamed protein product [Owenia fusiformis]|uniref:Uncharacterized protein n=1 Tax=Owenia fusiformis TaxID=6347 RepID=A0A8J1UH56_OWEFU|nr:unnamed protein product [Owenia fusiformis]